MAFLRESADGQQDLAAYLMGIGAGGVEMVDAASCQARLTGHTETSAPPAPAGRTLADVTPEELDLAVSALLSHLRLPHGHQGEAWDLENAIKAEWLKALEMRKHES
jgi:hypothetical protein